MCNFYVFNHDFKRIVFQNFDVESCNLEIYLSSRLIRSEEENELLIQEENRMAPLQVK